MWTIEYLGTEQSAAAWGLTAQPKIRTRDRSPTEISFRMAGADPAAAIPFPFQAQVIIRQNRTLTAGVWSGSGYVFTGCQTTQPGDVDGQSQGVTLVFKDAIWLMQNTTFQQMWTVNTASGSSVTTEQIPISRCVLFMDINSWVPNTYQSVQWQIQQIITYAASCGISIAAGTIDYSGWFLNYYHCRALSCWDALLKCLEPIPDAKVWVDGSGSTPVLNVRTRANLAALSAPSGTAPGPITLPYKGVDSAGRCHFSSKGFTPRYDLIPPQVVLQYQINTTVNGQAAPSFTTDAYPSGSTGQTPFAMVCPIDLSGASLTTEIGTLDCQALTVTAAQTGYSAGSAADHAVKRAWWASKRGGEQDRLADFRVRFGTCTIGDATVVDDHGNPINLAAYPNRIVKGAYHTWMMNGTTPIVAIRAHLLVTVQFAEWNVAGSTPAETDTNGIQVRKFTAHQLHCHVTLTNAPAGVTTFTGLQANTTTEETPVSGLAANIYNSRATLDYDGSHEIIDPGLPNASTPTAPLQQIIGHWNVLNLSGGATAWATANMTIAATEIDLVTHHIRIEVGPSKHLQPQDWNSMLQFFRYRRLYMASSQRATGYGDPANNVAMAANTPDANTVPGLAVPAVQSSLAPDATTGTYNNQITHDAANQALTFTQYNPDNSVNTKAGFSRVFSGTGAPASGTLTAGVQYQADTDLYLDLTTAMAPVMYVCTTSGDATTSIWAKVSGGGGGASVQQFKLVATGTIDGGDYWNCNTWDGTTLGGTIVKVAKQQKMRCVSYISGETIDGVPWTYSYAVNSYGEYVRTSASSSATTTDYCTPPALAGDIIYAVSFATASPTTLASVVWLEITPRDWASAL
jgi:hypothetical protein